MEDHTSQGIWTAQNGLDCLTYRTQNSVGRNGYVSWARWRINIIKVYVVKFSKKKKPKRKPQKCISHYCRDKEAPAKIVHITWDEASLPCHIIKSDKGMERELST